MSKYSLTSVGTKILCYIISTFISALLVIFIVFNLSKIGLIFLFLLLIFLMIGNFLIYNHKIVIKKDEIFIGNLKTIKRKISDIQSISVLDNPSIDSTKYCYIKFLFNDNTTYMIVGYESIFNKNATIKTKDIINSIKKDIGLLNK